jgi:transposase
VIRIVKTNLRKANKARKLAQRETHEHVRKRLLGVALLFEGVPLGQAARAVRATYHGLRAWAARAQRDGVDSLLNIRGGALRPQPNPELAALARDWAAHRTITTRVRKRLLAVAMVMEDEDLMATALRLRSSYDAVRKWVATAEQHGLEALLKARAGRNVERLQADPAQLRQLASNTADPAVRRRLLALANVASGMAVIDAAASVGATTAAITTWVRNFVEQGAEGIMRRGRAFRLKPGELWRVQTIVDKGPIAAPRDIAPGPSTPCGLLCNSSLATGILTRRSANCFSVPATGGRREHPDLAGPCVCTASLLSDSPPRPYPAHTNRINAVSPRRQFAYPPCVETTVCPVTACP